jgi:cytochrome b561
MDFKNNKDNYGIITILLHWLMALLIIALFALGLYMEDLDYYSKWYVAAPWWHKSVGLVVFGLLIFRVVLFFSHQHPAPLASYKTWEIKIAKLTHYSFYILLFVISISGYFIATAKGAGVEFFTFFEVPAISRFDKNLADIAGEIHEIAAYIMAFLFLLHVGATIKHHFLDKDTTLFRMLIPNKPKESNK